MLIGSEVTRSEDVMTGTVNLKELSTLVKCDEGRKMEGVHDESFSRDVYRPDSAWDRSIWR